MPMVVRKSGSEDTLRVDTPSGHEHWDLSQLNARQRQQANEMIVDFWCKEHGYAPIYGDKQ